MEVQVKSVSFLWVPSTLLLVLAGSWFALMELLLQHPDFDIRAAIAALIVLYGSLCLRYSRSRASSLRPLTAVSALATLAIGVYAIYGDLHSSQFEGYILLIAAALVGQSLLTLAQTLPAPTFEAQTPDNSPTL